MPRIHLVRHGQASATWEQALDPGLSDLGREQAEAVARDLAPLGPLALFASPLARAQETAAPLARLWSRTPVIEPRLAEIPKPRHEIADRGAWLRGIMEGTWEAAGEDLSAWRDIPIGALVGQREDCVIFSHFVPINVCVGHCLGRPEVVVFRPDYCSVTIFETDGTTLRLVEKGREADTVVR